MRFQGALFATVFLEIAKHIFTWYVGTVVQFGTIYGPLTAFVVFLLCGVLFLLLLHLFNRP